MTSNLFLNPQMTVDNMVLSFVLPLSSTMDMSRSDHMSGGRMATVRPTHIRLPPVSQHCSQDEVDEEKDNAFNLAIRYQGQNSNTGSRKSSTKSKVGPSGNLLRHSDKKSGVARSVSLSLPKGYPVIIKNNSSHLSTDSTTGGMLVCSAQGSDKNLWALTPVVVVSEDSTSTFRQKTSSTSSSSGSSSEDATDRDRATPTFDETVARDLQSSPFGDDPSPPVPPRGSNCYENIPVPGIIPLSKSKNQTDAHRASGSDSISLYSRLSGLSNKKDVERISLAVERLNASGFFYENITATEAKVKLRASQVGTFLVRLSSQASHFFALSVKTNRGTTSIRLTHENGNFRLDADPHSAAKMPSFNCIVALIEHYVVQSASDARNKCVFLESNGRRDTPVILTRPYRDDPQSLKHLCRRTLHYYYSQDKMTEVLSKPKPCSVQLIQYIQSYPYAL